MLVTNTSLLEMRGLYIYRGFIKILYQDSEKMIKIKALFYLILLIYIYITEYIFEDYILN